LTLENEEVVTAISDKGEPDIMVCSNEEKDEKVCVSMNENEDQSETSILSSGIINNNIYNLMEQLVNENKSLWRIKNNYKNDAADDIEIQEMWNFIERDKRELVKLLTEKLKERL